VLTLGWPRGLVPELVWEPGLGLEQALVPVWGQALELEQEQEPGPEFPRLRHRRPPAGGTPPVPAQSGTPWAIGFCLSSLSLREEFP